MKDGETTLPKIFLQRLQNAIFHLFFILTTYCKSEYKI